MKVPPILVLVAVTTLLRLGFAAATGLGVDESYMVTAGRVLGLGYFDHPPAAWWLSWGAEHLLGTETPVTVRLPFILLFALSQVLMDRLGRLVVDQRAGFWAAVALNLSPVFGVTTGSWVLPDGPLDTALLAAVLCLFHALSGDVPSGDTPSGDYRAMRWWSGAGVCAGLALFSKYTAVLPIAGVVLYLLTSPRHRYWLGRPQPYLAALLALVVFAPVPLWNALHGWASFAFQGDRAVGVRFRPLLPFNVLAGEALFVLPWIWLPMMLLFGRCFQPDAPWRHRLLACLAAPSILGFALLAAWSSQRILFHWAAPGYLMLFPLLGQAIAERLDRTWVQRLIAATAVLVLATCLVIVAQLQWDWLGNRVAGLSLTEPTEQGLDWLSIRDDLRARGLLPPGVLVAALNWRDAGKIGYALGPDVIMLCLSRDARQFGFADPPHEYDGRPVLLLALALPEQAIHAAKPWFHDVQLLSDTSIRLANRVLRTVTVLRGDALRAGS